MIALLSQREADRLEVPATQVRCISPYVNPAHVLAPPRHWLEALVNGEYSWPFFRLRYKALLRERYRAEPERFHALLDASEGERALYLTCHCMTDQCHRQLAAAFLERVRRRRPAVARRPEPPRRAEGAARASERSARRPHVGHILSTLIEHPHAPAVARG